MMREKRREEEKRRHDLNRARQKEKQVVGSQWVLFCTAAGVTCIIGIKGSTRNEAC